jgi:hypothetical protein
MTVVSKSEICEVPADISSPKSLTPTEIMVTRIIIGKRERARPGFFIY